MASVDEHEREIHSSLYENVYLLSVAYGNPVLFDKTHLQDHLKPDMFVKANKFAFEQVIYFLLNVINPEYQKKITWPLLDKKMESQFRNDVKNIMKSLNDIYEDARIPVVQTSHMIFPGGSKCVRLLWYVSELAMLEYLRRNYGNEDDISSSHLSFRVNKDLEKSQLRLYNINRLVDTEYSNLISLFAKSKQRILELVEETKKIVAEINILQKATVQKGNVPEGISYQLVNDMSNFQDATNKNFEDLKQLQQMTQTVSSLKTYLDIITQKDETFALTFHTESLSYQKISYDIFNKSKELNLMKFLQVIDNILKEYTINFEILSLYDSTTLETKYLSIINDYANLLNELINVCKPQLLDMNNDFQKRISYYNEFLMNKQSKFNVELNETPELNFDVSFSNRKIFQDVSSATSVKRQTIMETLTTLKKRPLNRSLNLSEKVTHARRNIISSENKTPSNLTTKENIVSTAVLNFESIENKAEAKSSPCGNSNNIKINEELSVLTPDNIKEDISMLTPSVSSTPINVGSSRGKRLSEIRQLLSTNSQTLKSNDVSRSSFNISKEIIDLLTVDDDLNSSNLVFNVIKP